MPANIDPIYPLSAKVGIAQVSVANTNRDGTGTLVTMFTAGANGSFVQRGYIKATVTTTAGMIRIFLTDGVTTWLVTEVVVEAITVSGSVAGFAKEIPLLRGMLVPANWVMRAATNNAETFNVVAEYGDY